VGRGRPGTPSLYPGARAPVGLRVSTRPERAIDGRRARRRSVVSGRSAQRLCCPTRRFPARVVTGRCLLGAAPPRARRRQAGATDCVGCRRHLAAAPVPRLLPHPHAGELEQAMLPRAADPR
jgi:hypothetical protein